jgi:hypothetical protein
MEVLEYIIQKSSPISKSNEQPRHYVLQGFFTHELDLARSLESYFNEFGIGLIPFARDEHDWEQLATVIEHLAKEIPFSAPLNLSKRLDMEALLP